MPSVGALLHQLRQPRHTLSQEQSMQWKAHVARKENFRRSSLSLIKGTSPGLVHISSWNRGSAEQRIFLVGLFERQVGSSLRERFGGALLDEPRLPQR